MAGRLVSPILVARSSEVVSMAEALDAALDERPIHLVISGEAGIGKSRLVDELASQATDRGLLVARGACVNMGDGGLPYGPIVEALRWLVRNVEPDALQVAVGSAGPDLARLVPDVAPGTGIADTIQQNWLQARVLEALLGFFHRLSQQAPLLLIVEDLHWADPASLDAIAFLVRNLRSDRVLIAMTVRSDELHRRHPLLPWLAEMERAGGTERLSLQRLSPAETTELLAAILGSAPSPELQERIHQRSDGNPFFVEELVLADQDPDGSHRLPPTLREVLLARIASVPDAAQAVLGAAAVVGRRVDHDLLATIAGLSEPTLLEAVRMAVTAQLLVADAGSGRDAGYAFRHALVEEVVYDDLLPGDRRRLHRACAAALTARPAGSGGTEAAHWAAIAHHWLAAHDDRAALEASVRAGEAADRTFAFDASRRHYERALELWAAVEDADRLAGVDRIDILGRAAGASILIGDTHRAVTLRREALAAIDPTSDPVRAAVLRELLARALFVHGDTAGALEAYEQAVALMPADRPSAERARVLSGLGQILMLVDRWADSQRTCEEAIAIARQVDAREAEGHALSTLGVDLAVLGHGAGAAAAIERGLGIAREVRNVDDIGRAYVNLANALLFSGDAHRAAAVADEGIEAAEAYGFASSYGCFIRDAGTAANVELGRWETAARLAGESTSLGHGRPFLDRYRLARWVGLLAATGGAGADIEIGRLGEILRQGPVEMQFSGPFHAAKAEHSLWQGRPEEALATIEGGLNQLDGKNHWYWHELRLHRVGARAAADLAEVARARRDPAAEQDAVRRAATLRLVRPPTEPSDLPAEGGPAADEMLAEVATTLAEDGRLLGASDPGAWREALARWRGRQRPYLIAYVRWREGEALLSARDRPGAGEALTEAASIAATLGAVPLLEAIQSLARRSRIRLEMPVRLVESHPGTVGNWADAAAMVGPAAEVSAVTAATAASAVSAATSVAAATSASAVSAATSVTAATAASAVSAATSVTAATAASAASAATAASAVTAASAADAAFDPFGLTAREREVLAHVASGRTNRQIGEALFITGNTAGVHVSNILGKLGATSRTEAAGIAVRLGLATID